MKALTLAEIESILSRASPPYSIMVTLGSRHGMRSSEIVGLKRADVDLVARSITIRRLKGSNTSTQPLGDAEALALADWLKTVRESPYVFPGRNTPHLTRNAYFKWFRHVAELAGIPKDRRHPHTLRHSLAYRLVEANISLPIVQAALGHVSIASTAVYSRPSESTVNKTLISVIGG
jgi:integrase